MICDLMAVPIAFRGTAMGFDCFSWHCHSTAVGSHGATATWRCHWIWRHRRELSQHRQLWQCNESLHFQCITPMKMSHVSPMGGPEALPWEVAWHCNCRAVAAVIGIPWHPHACRFAITVPWHSFSTMGPAVRPYMTLPWESSMAYAMAAVGFHGVAIYLPWACMRLHGTAMARNAARALPWDCHGAMTSPRECHGP